jgi:hypothetical protein
MRLTNLATEASRITDVGALWAEVLTSGTGTFRFPPYTTFRVRCLTSGTTVTVNGVLAATMTSGEVMLFNTGPLPQTDLGGGGSGMTAPYNRQWVTVVIGVAAGRLQVARNLNHQE